MIACLSFVTVRGCPSFSNQKEELFVRRPELQQRGIALAEFGPYLNCMCTCPVTEVPAHGYCTSTTEQQTAPIARTTLEAAKQYTRSSTETCAEKPHKQPRTETTAGLYRSLTRFILAAIEETEDILLFPGTRTSAA